MARATITLLLIQSDQLVRADFSGGDKLCLQQLWRQARPGELAPPELAAAALKLGPRCGRSVWVLAEDLWTQTLAFPVATVAGLNDAQLARACAFEAEPLSEIAGTDAALGVMPTDISQDMRSFWITAADTGTRQHIQTLVRNAGGKFRGLLHPGGLPAPLGGIEKGQAWSRVEVWRKATFCLSGHGPARSRIQVFNAAATQPRVQSGIAAWTSGADPRGLELLDADRPSAAALPAGPGRTLKLADEQELGRWLLAWAGALAGEAVQAPVIAPAPQATPRRVFVAVGIAAELLMLAACGAHWLYVDKARRAVSAEVTSRQDLEKQASDLKKSFEDAKRDADKLAAASNELERSRKQMERDFAQQRNHIELLLASLAAKRPGDMVIQSISASDANVLKIRGKALDSSLSDQLATGLSESLWNTGWCVEALDKESDDLLSNGGPWSFTLAVRDPGVNPLGNAALPEPGAGMVRRRR